MTNRVSNLRFRAPELLFGSKNYDSKVDIWSAGIMIADIILQKSLFYADTEIRQVDQLIEKCGSLENDWPEAKNLPNYTDLIKSNKYVQRSLVSYIRKLKPKYFF